MLSGSGVAVVGCIDIISQTFHLNLYYYEWDRNLYLKTLPNGSISATGEWILDDSVSFYYKNLSLENFISWKMAKLYLCHYQTLCVDKN